VAILGQDLSALVVVALPAVALLAQTVLEGLFLEE
jgi:hypothetical protein